MTLARIPGREARRSHGFLMANKWLLARRLSQLTIFMLFAAGPWFGLWLVEGTLSSSVTLDVLPLTDPAFISSPAGVFTARGFARSTRSLTSPRGRAGGSRSRPTGKSNLKQDCGCLPPSSRQPR